MTDSKGLYDNRILYVVLSVIAGFLIGALILVVVGISPLQACYRLFKAVLGSPKNVLWTLCRAAPLILTGLSVTLSMKTGIFNIGAEGQYIMGALVSVVLGISLKLPPFLHVTACFAGAALAGAAWALLVVWLKLKKGTSEIVLFIMFNWIAMYLSNFVTMSEACNRPGWNTTFLVSDTARILLPEKLRMSLVCVGADYGFLIAAAAAVLIWVFLHATTGGFRMSAVGKNIGAARYSGIDSDKTVLTAAGMAGALSGIAGAVVTLGLSGRVVLYSVFENYGFDGIIVALMGCLHPLGCILSGVFYGALRYGAARLVLLGTSRELIELIVGCIILFTALGDEIRTRVRNRK